MKKKYDHLILGAGIYGLHAACILSQKGQKVAVVEHDSGPFQRASYINQARVHQGYHYPRSVSTAMKSAKYYKHFNEEFSFAINRAFKKIYAISSINSLSNAVQFKKFCDYVKIPAVEINKDIYFNSQYVEAAYETEEYAFDPFMIRDFLMRKIEEKRNVDFFFNARLTGVETGNDSFTARFKEPALTIEAPSVINTTYASSNQILKAFGFPFMKIKYEICEVILVDVDSSLQDAGLTVMDGPFFSVMPFGLIGKHSLTSVSFTPHLTSYEALPTFPCQANYDGCTPEQLGNCNICPARPSTAWNYMSQLAKKYLRSDSSIKYSSSLFAIKPILTAAELDDSRPTLIRSFSESPSFISVLSGKINTIYDLDEVLS